MNPKRRRRGLGRRLLVFLVFLGLTAAMVAAGFAAGRFLMDKILFPTAGSAAPQVKTVEPVRNGQESFLSRLWDLVRRKNAAPAGSEGPVATTGSGAGIIGGGPATGSSGDGTSGTGNVPATGSGSAGGAAVGATPSGGTPVGGAAAGGGPIGGGPATGAGGSTGVSGAPSGGTSGGGNIAGGGSAPASGGSSGRLAVDAGLNVFEIYVAQVAAYRTPSLAADRVQALEGYGWPAYLDRGEPDGLIKVRVGAFGALGPARDLSDKIVAAGFKSIPLLVVLGHGGETFRGRDRALLETMRDTVKQTSYLIWEEAGTWGEQYQKKATLSQVADRGLKFRAKVAALEANLRAAGADASAAPTRTMVTRMLAAVDAHFAALTELKSKPSDNAAYLKAARSFGTVIEQYASVVRSLK